MLKEIYFKTIFGRDEKLSFSSFSKYVFLDCPERSLYILRCNAIGRDVTKHSDNYLYNWTFLMNCKPLSSHRKGYVGAEMMSLWDNIRKYRNIESAIRELWVKRKEMAKRMTKVADFDHYVLEVTEDSDFIWLLRIFSKDDFDFESMVRPHLYYSGKKEINPTRFQLIDI